MIRMIYKLAIAMIALLAAAGTVSAGAPAPLDIPDWTQIGTANPVTPSNILSTNGVFRNVTRRNGSTVFIYNASYLNGATVSLEDALGPSTPIDKGTVVATGGTITVKGVDPLGDTNTRVTLVTADYDDSMFNFSLNDSQVGFLDLFGVSTTNIQCISTWTFCTTNESFYVAGDFGPNTNRIFLLNDATAVTTIPVPAAFWLFSSGLLGLIAISRRRKTA